jgi:tRNA pseudouridine55 synthase
MNRASSKPEQAHGVLVLDKPSGPTSADCLNRIKHGLGQKKIGHAGTLDPLASGLLLVLLGKGTKLAPYLMGGAKTYSGEFILGLTTDTYDIQGSVVEEKHWEHVSPEDVEAGVASWTRMREQEVPPVSAAKHKGRPLYALARAGEEVPVKTKSIEVHRAETLRIDPPRVSFRTVVGPGAYIRSLVHSLGMRLGTGAALTALVREGSGAFGLEKAHGLDEVLEDPEGFPDKVLSMREALADWPVVRLDREAADLVRNGAWLPVDGGPRGPEAGEKALLAGPDNEALALAEAKSKDGRIRWSILRGLWL